MIQKAINELVEWIQVMEQSMDKGEVATAKKAMAELQKFGVTVANNRITYGAVPTLEGGVHVARPFIVDFNKIRDAFLKDYNAFLKKRGKRPVRLAA
ncbi:MAG: hypothetical protein WC813_01370 [Patescibacteria group bacterium]|jgi:hypothetical protein